MNIDKRDVLELKGRCEINDWLKKHENEIREINGDYLNVNYIESDLSDKGVKKFRGNNLDEFIKNEDNIKNIEIFKEYDLDLHISIFSRNAKPIDGILKIETEQIYIEDDMGNKIYIKSKEDYKINRYYIQKSIPKKLQLLKVCDYYNSIIDNQIMLSFVHLINTEGYAENIQLIPQDEGFKINVFYEEINQVTFIEEYGDKFIEDVRLLNYENQSF